MHPARRLSLTALLLAIALAAAGGSRTEAQAPHQGLSVRITSPLGRTGVPGAVRIVAQVQAAAGAARAGALLRG